MRLRRSSATRSSPYCRREPSLKMISGEKEFSPSSPDHGESKNRTVSVPKSALPSSRSPPMLIVTFESRRREWMLPETRIPAAFLTFDSPPRSAPRTDLPGKHSVGSYKYVTQGG